MVARPFRGNLCGNLCVETTLSLHMDTPSPCWRQPCADSDASTGMPVTPVTDLKCRNHGRSRHTRHPPRRGVSTVSQVLLRFLPPHRTARARAANPLQQNLVAIPNPWIPTWIPRSGYLDSENLQTHEHQSTTDFLGTASEWWKCHGVLKSTRCVEFHTVAVPSGRQISPVFEWSLRF